jgi:hypothetical protein
LLPVTAGLATALTVLGLIGFAPAIAAAAPPAEHGNNLRDQEWWLAGLQIPQAWRKSEGAGITVAVLGTGVDAGYPGLAGSVITGPDYTGSGREPGSPYWGVQGTAVAGIVASHRSGWGLVGVAPAAKILSVRVTLEFNDPLAADRAISRRLPQAIADGIRYAADHGARVIDLPLDPGTLGLTGKSDPAAAGGSPAERAAVAYALSKGAVLIAPAGDDGQGPGLVDYPAAYPGVLAVGAIGQTGQLAPFSSRRSYPSLTAPGVSLVSAAPPDGVGKISSTSAASGIVAGVAALVLSRYPQLSAAQVTQALIESTVAGGSAGAGLPPLPARSAAGAGYGTVDAIRAVDMAAIITTASQPPPSASAAPSAPPSAGPSRTARHQAAAAHRAPASDLAGSVLRDAVAAVAGLIVLLVIALVVVRSRRERGRAKVAGRTRTRGQHEIRKPGAGDGPAGAGAAAGSGPAGGRAPRLGPAASAGRPPEPAGWTSPAGWQGGGLGELRPALDAATRPVVAAPKPAGYRSSRDASRPGRDPGPPWAPAPAPERFVGPLPVAAVSFDLTTPPADFDLAAPASGLPGPVFGVARPARQSLDFAAAPVPADHAAPPADDAPVPGDGAPDDGPAER